MQDQTATQQIKLSGSLAVSRAPFLQTQILQALDAGGSVCLDVSDGTDIDIGFLQILVAAHKTATDEGKSLIVSDHGADHLREQIARCGLPDAALPKIASVSF